jgi:uncharacterized iron-regulated membrane protein
MPHIRDTVAWLSVASFAAVFAAVSIVAHAGAQCGTPHIVLASVDLLPIAVVLGAGVLTWLLGNRRPRLEPARPRKPEPARGRRSRQR